MKYNKYKTFDKMMEHLNNKLPEDKDFSYPLNFKKYNPEMEFKDWTDGMTSYFANEFKVRCVYSSWDQEWRYFKDGDTFDMDAFIKDRSFQHQGHHVVCILPWS